MTSVPTDYDSARAALTRLIPIAMSDTGQARRVADFLMAWWNGPDLGQNDRGAVYIDSLGFTEEMQDIIAHWRSPGARPDA